MTLLKIREALSSCSMYVPSASADTQVREVRLGEKPPANASV